MVLLAYIRIVSTCLGFDLHFGVFLIRIRMIAW